MDMLSYNYYCLFGVVYLLLFAAIEQCVKINRNLERLINISKNQSTYVLPENRVPVSK